MSICKYCNKEFHDKRRPNGSQCVCCKNIKRRWKKKLKYVSLKGGKCCKCGYNKNIGALQFHHVKEKSFSLIASQLCDLEENIILEELDKCVLLCANCHAEEHCSYDIIERYYSDAENK